MTGSEQGRERWLIGLLTLVFVVKGVLWSAAFPLWQGPDEDDHYAVIQFIGETGRLPDAGDVWLPDEVALSRELADVGRLDYQPEQRQAFGPGAVGPREAEFAALPDGVRTSVSAEITGKLMHATPLYYILAVPVYRLTADGTLLERAFAQRAWAVLVSAPLVWLAYAISRHLFPRDAALRLTVPFLVTFHPMISEIAAVVSVDGLFFVLYSAAILLCLRVARDGLTRQHALLIAVVFAAGLLIKPTMNGIAPVVALVVAVDWWRRPAARRTVFWNAVLMNVVILVPVGWWMQRSLRLNDDLFYFNPVLKGHRIITNPVTDYPFWQHAVDYWRSVWGGMFVTWWAHFGWIDTPLPGWVYHLLRFLTVLALVGLTWRLAQRVRRDGARATLPALWPWLVLAATIVLPALLLQYYDLSFWHTYGVGRGLQGRYWLGTVVPMLALWAVGLLAWVPDRLRPGAHALLRGGMVLLNFAGLLGAVLPRYYL